jgi:tyrosyl-tRNA synthetase
MNQEIMDMLLNVIYSLIIVGMGALGTLTFSFLKEKVGIEKLERIKQELENKQKLAKIAVLFIQQVYKDYNGEDKYNKAVEALVSLAVQNKIKLNENEIKLLIESALKSFKNEFGEQWKNV